jgi:potassium-dependent mechanosensitive channel
MPVPAALILSLLGSRWLYPDAPRLLWPVLGALALVPSVLVLRRLMRSEFHPLLYSLIAFFLLDQIRSVAAAVPFLPRLLFLGEMIAVIVMSMWLAASEPQRPADNAGSRRIRKIAAYIALAISSVAFAAKVFGYVTFGTLLGNALLQSSYLALILYTSVEVLDSLVTVALSTRPFAALGTVSRHRSLLRRRIRRGLQSLGMLLWMLVVLQRLLLRERLFGAVHEFLTAELIFVQLRFPPAMCWRSPLPSGPPFWFLGSFAFFSTRTCIPALVSSAACRTRFPTHCTI